MAILKSTVVNGDLTVTGSLNVQGDLTYVGVNNLRVKDHQIELNATDSGSASLAGANEAGIVIRGARKTENVVDDASILYNHADDTLVVNKTIKGTVSNATTAASAAKVANPLTVNVTDETGSKKTVTFDGSAAETVSVDLSGLQNQINSLTGGAGSIATQISNAIKELDVTDAAVDGQYVSSVSEADGKIAVTRAALPDYTEVYDAKGAAAQALKDAKAYANSLASNYDAAGAAATAEQNAKDYADGLASNYDAAGTAAQALTDAKAYADGLAVNYDAKGSAASALADAKTYVNNKVDGKFDATGSAATAKTEAIADAKKYTDDEIKKLGSAAKKNVLEGAIADSTSEDLVTAAQVKAYAAGVVGAMHFRGAVENTDAITDPASGDICLVGTKEYVYNGSAWVLFGDEGAYDTKGSAGKALEDAKKYADGLNTAMDGRVDALESASHTHANKDELDKIAVGDKAKWDNHVANADIHVTAEQKAAWTAKQNALANADVLATITSNKVTNWDDAASKAHKHTNKTVLDGITEAKVTAWDGAVSAARVSSVNGKSGALTLKGGSKTLGDVNLSISDGGEISAAIVPDSFDSFGAAAAVKTELIGKGTSDKDSDTIEGAKKHADAAVNALSGSVATTDAAQNTKISNIENSITGIENSYVKKAGDTMTGNLTMPSNGTNGIIFGNMKIVWKDNAIEFIPTTA